MLEFCVNPQCQDIINIMFFLHMYTTFLAHDGMFCPSIGFCNIFNENELFECEND